MYIWGATLIKNASLDDELRQKRTWMASLLFNTLTINYALLG